MLELCVRVYVAVSSIWSHEKHVSKGHTYSKNKKEEKEKRQ
jgi:uncharacterized C2H2 Zn-finger protein